MAPRRRPGGSRGHPAGRCWPASPQLSRAWARLAWIRFQPHSHLPAQHELWGNG
jgi:hypothetical protein